MPFEYASEPETSTRRRIGAAGVVLFVAALFASTQASALQAAARAQPGGPVFGYEDVVTLARKLAAKPYVPQRAPLPQQFQTLGYDQYRDIRFKPASAVWRADRLPFQLQMFHRARYYADRVSIHLIENGKPLFLPYTSDLFTFGPLLPPSSAPAGAKPNPETDLGFAGFRIHAPLNRPDYYDEVAVFQGASYFRSLARDEAYGLSGRGLAIKTADPSGEEFPRFTSFWIERPAPDSGTITVNALLDSPSVAGAYRFVIRPGTATIMDVKATLFPRVALSRVGIAPMSSMFFFGPNDRGGTDDFRPAVHDSDGLEIYSGAGEWVWRPLANPAELQVSAFIDRNPRGFGLMQRARRFSDYEDLEASYERRPSLWVEPHGEWGEGNVILVEIPTDSEVHDNIVAFWRPKAPIPVGKPSLFNYTLTWADMPPIRPSLAQVQSTSIGRNLGNRDRLIVIDYGADAFGAPAKPPEASVTASAGRVSSVVVQANPHTSGWRLTFQLDPGTADLIELRALLTRSGGPASETWLYRWTRG